MATVADKPVKYQICEEAQRQIIQICLAALERDAQRTVQATNQQTPATA